MDSKYCNGTMRHRAFQPVYGYCSYWLNRNSPPTRHLTSCLTGGLDRLIKNISRGVTQQDHDYGQYTDTDGAFCPEVGMPLLAHRYQFVEIIGKGQSSVLIRAKDTFSSGKSVAIKLLHAHYVKLGPQEVDCMRRLNMADPYDVSSTLRLMTVFKFDEHYSMVFELLYSRPLADIFCSIPRDEIIPCLRKVAKNLLKAVGFLQQQGVIHADLKPENILLKKKGDLDSLKVVDFGNAIRCVHEELSLYYDDYDLQTLLYRAPEVMFGLTFGLEVDLWSFGCILSELYTKRALFPGRDKKQVLEKIVSILGPVPEDMCMSGKFYNEFKHYTSKNCKNFTTSDMMKHLGCRDYCFADFVTKLLKYRPSERMTVQEAACHPFLATELGTAFFLPPGEIKRMRLDSRALLGRGTCKVPIPVVVKTDPVTKFEARKVAEVTPVQRTNGLLHNTQSRQRTTQINQTAYYPGINASISLQLQLPGTLSNGVLVSADATNALSLNSDTSHSSNTSSAKNVEVIDLTSSPEAELVSLPVDSPKLESVTCPPKSGKSHFSDISPYVPVSDSSTKFFPGTDSCSSASASRDLGNLTTPAVNGLSNSSMNRSDTRMSWQRGLQTAAATSTTDKRPAHREPNLTLSLRPFEAFSKDNTCSSGATTPESPPRLMSPNYTSVTPSHDQDTAWRNKPLKKRIRTSLFQEPVTPTDPYMPEQPVAAVTGDSRDSKSFTANETVSSISHLPNPAQVQTSINHTDSLVRPKLEEMWSMQGQRPMQVVEASTDQNHNSHKSLHPVTRKSSTKRQRVEPDSTQSPDDFKLVIDIKPQSDAEEGSSPPVDTSPEGSMFVEIPLSKRPRRTSARKNRSGEGGLQHLLQQLAPSRSRRRPTPKQSSKGKKCAAQTSRDSESSSSEEVRQLDL